MSWLSSMFKTSTPQQENMGLNKVSDPYREAVASPLSSYLASQVGKGIGTYPGQVNVPLGQDFENVQSRFLKMDPGELYQKYVYEPTMKGFKEDLLPVISEQYAGGLRGSARALGIEDASTKLSTELAKGRYTAETEIPKTQFEMGKQYYQLRQDQADREYNSWLRSLPQYNPALGSAVSFLTSPGSETTYAYQKGLQPTAEKSMWSDLLPIALQEGLMFL